MTVFLGEYKQREEKCDCEATAKKYARERRKEIHVIGLLSKLFSIQFCFYRIAISICLSLNRYQDHFTLTMVAMKLMLFPFSSLPLPSTPILSSFLSGHLLSFSCLPSSLLFPSLFLNIFSLSEYFFQVLFFSHLHTTFV